METQNVITHLIEVEQLADELIVGSQKEADARIAKVRAEADAKYRVAYDELMRGLDAEFAAASAAGDERRTTLSEEYKRNLSAITVKTDEFNAFLDSVLFGDK